MSGVCVQVSLQKSIPSSPVHPTALPAFNWQQGSGLDSASPPPVPVSISYLAHAGLAAASPARVASAVRSAQRTREGLWGLPFCGLAFLSTRGGGQRYKPRWYSQFWADVCAAMHARHAQQVPASIVSRTLPTNSHTPLPPGRMPTATPPGLLRYDTSALSRQIRLSIASPKYIRTLALASPHELSTPQIIRITKQQLLAHQTT